MSGKVASFVHREADGVLNLVGAVLVEFQLGPRCLGLLLRLVQHCAKSAIP